MSSKKKNKKPVYVGLSITQTAIEAAVFDPKAFSIVQSSSCPVPEGLFDEDGDRVLDEGLLKEVIGEVLRDLKLKSSVVHLSVPGTLLRMVEMQRMGESELYVALSSEAERYKTFDDADAIVDFADIESENQNPQGQHNIVFGAIRSDSMQTYQRVAKQLKFKIASVTLEPLNVLRAMAGTGVLDSLIMQIGQDAHWGTIFVEPTRIRISLWQANRLLELRETQMMTHDFASATGDSMVVEDIVEEIRRTTKMAQPSIWLTHNMPFTMEQILNERLNVPFRAAPLGDSMTMSDPNLQIATVGCALTSMVSYPFDFDILSGIGRGTVGGSAEFEDVNQANIDWLVPVGGGVLLLCLVATGLMYLISSFSGAQIPQLQTQKETKQAEVAQLQAEQKALQEKVDLDTRLLDMIRSAAVRNHVYVALTDDVKNRIPLDSWVHTMVINKDNTVEIQGVTKTHEDAIQFARSFDNIPYVQGVTIGAIKQTLIGPTPVFNFTITGNLNPDPSLLNQFIDAQKTEESAKAPEGLAEPGGQ